MNNICGLTGLYPEAAASPGAPASSSLLPPSARCSATDGGSEVSHHCTSSSQKNITTENYTLCSYTATSGVVRWQIATRSDGSTLLNIALSSTHIT